jgi:hypothetical protein
MLMKDLLKATVLMLMDWVGMKCFNQLCYRKYICVVGGGCSVYGREGGWAVSVLKGQNITKYPRN